MSAERSAAISAAAAWFDGGGLLDELRGRVGIRTESQKRDSAAALSRYLTDEIGPATDRLGFRREHWDNPVAGAPPMLFAERITGLWVLSLNLAMELDQLQSTCHLRVLVPRPTGSN
jgi:hypothetical protein